MPVRFFVCLNYFFFWISLQLLSRYLRYIIKAFIFQNSPQKFCIFLRVQPKLQQHHQIELKNSNKKQDFFFAILKILPTRKCLPMCQMLDRNSKCAVSEAQQSISLPSKSHLCMQVSELATEPEAWHGCHWFSLFPHSHNFLSLSLSFITMSLR